MPRPRLVSGRVLIALSGLALLAAYLGSGVFVVDTDEQAVVRRFGEIVSRVGPGINYRLPWPVDQVDSLRTTTVKKTGVGFVAQEFPHFHAQRLGLGRQADRVELDISRAHVRPP